MVERRQRDVTMKGRKGKTMKERSLPSRRDFLKIGGVTGALCASASLLAACSGPSAPSGDPSSSDAGKVTEVDETLECDIVVVGAGGSGLAACVQAAEMGAKVICLESQAQTGGNEVGTEGIFAVGSSLQRKAGIEVDPGEVVRDELAQSQNKASGLHYNDLIKNSADNIEWLIDHGCRFGEVDNYMNSPLSVFHWWEGGTGATGYVPYMTESAEKAGVEFMFDTEAREIVQDAEGSVTGVIASSRNGVTRINAKAVILSTGGFAGDAEAIQFWGYDPDTTEDHGFPGHNGTGRAMALSAGACDNAPKVSFLGSLIVKGLPGYFQGGKFSFLIGIGAPYSLWVNENGERFVNEDFSLGNQMLMNVPTLLNKATYIVFDKTTMDMFTAGEQDALDQLAEGIESGEIVSGETLDELAAHVQFDAAMFASTVDAYNANARDGVDLEFGKDPSFMIPCEQAPFYAVRTCTEVLPTIASICTDREYRAINIKKEPVPGLWVTGVEGSMLWSGVYTINIPGMCNAGNIHSGRTAAKSAVAFVQAG